MGLLVLLQGPARAQGSTILSNDKIRIALSDDGKLEAVENVLASEIYSFGSDGFAIDTDLGIFSNATTRPVRVTADTQRIVYQFEFGLETAGGGAGIKVNLIYTLTDGNGFFRRTLSVSNAVPLRVKNLVFGRTTFSSPARETVHYVTFIAAPTVEFIRHDKGGLFTGIENPYFQADLSEMGVEFLAQKTVGKTTGWVGYTWSKTERLFDRPGQEINFGKVFPAKFDRRHDISLVVAHKFSEKFDIAATWVYSTGNAGSLALQNYSQPTLPESVNFFYGSNSLPHLSARNNYRMPSYHRLDLGANVHKQKKHGIRTWSFGVYNAYNQMNPFFVYPDYDYMYSPNGFTTAQKSLKKITIFPFIPSVSYSYKF
jgi:hypothetical protein